MFKELGKQGDISIFNAVVRKAVMDCGVNKKMAANRIVERRENSPSHPQLDGMRLL